MSTLQKRVLCVGAGRVLRKWSGPKVAEGVVVCCAPAIPKRRLNKDTSITTWEARFGWVWDNPVSCERMRALLDDQELRQSKAEDAVKCRCGHDISVVMYRKEALKRGLLLCWVEDCWFQATGEKDLQKHVLGVHGQMIRIGCPLSTCASLVSSLRNQRNHAESNMSTHGKGLHIVCPEKGCRVVCDSHVAMDLHLEVLHPTFTGHMCPATRCGRSFRTRTMLENHLRALHKTEAFGVCARHGCGKIISKINPIHVCV